MGGDKQQTGDNRKCTVRLLSLSRSYCPEGEQLLHPSDFTSFNNVFILINLVLMGLGITFPTPRGNKMDFLS